MNRFGMSQAARRVEDARFLAGPGRYVDDIHRAGVCPAVSVLSRYPHARIRRIDTSQALAVEGALRVLTGADAAELIDIEYEPLDAVTNLEAAVGPGAPGERRKPCRFDTHCSDF